MRWHRTFKKYCSEDKTFSPLDFASSCATAQTTSRTPTLTIRVEAIEFPNSWSTLHLRLTPFNQVGVTCGSKMPVKVAAC